MKIKNQNKGITLVALIITIIVLLILAVVAISAVNYTGIIQYAQNSADEHEKRKDEEEQLIQDYTDYINENVIPKLNFWQENGMTSENVKFDVLYTDNNIDIFECPFTIGFYSNGNLCLDIASISVPNGSMGSHGNTKEYIIENNFITNSVVKIFENGFTIPFMVGTQYYFTFRYTEDNTVKMYVASSLPEEGHVPEEDTYLVGTLLPQS